MAGLLGPVRSEQLRTYAIEIDPAEWQSMDAEFHNLTALATGTPFATYHPIVFHLDNETVANAAIKLHGQSSWMQTVMFDGDRAKMQFDISFDKVDPERQVPRRGQAGLRHAAVGLDVPARSSGARLVAPERHHGHLHRQRAR